jgi:RecA/RadA recombinase
MVGKLVGKGIFNMNLMEKMLGAGSVKQSEVLSDSSYFAVRDSVKTELPILNIAFGGQIDGGLVPGLTVFAGESKSFKTMLGLYCLKAYFNKYKDAVCLFYDSEFSVTPKYIANFGIDATRVIHIPIEHVEQLKFDIVKRLEQVKRGDKVFIFVDSLGNLASKKEIDDAIDEKSVADMTRAKSIRSLLRIITPHLAMKDLPCIMVNHVYKTMEMYSKNVIPGGTAVMYSANQIFIITKAQEKDKDNNLLGFTFTINIEKSRFIKEKSKLPFEVSFEDGIYKWSGLLDLAVDAGVVIKTGAKATTKYSLVNSDGEISPESYKEKNIPDEFYEDLLENDLFKKFVVNKFSFDQSNIGEDDAV